MSQVFSRPDEIESAMDSAIDIYLRSPLSSHPTQETSVRPKDNVVALGIGNKIVRHRSTRTRCLRFYVIKKTKLSGEFREYCLPKRFEGLPTDVIEIGGPFRALAVRPTCQKRLRPARPGCSVGFELPHAPSDVGSAGTIGAFVRLLDGRFGILSNNHVLANVDQLPLRTPILQPGIADDGRPDRDRIGELWKTVPIGSENVDCAVALVDNNADMNPVMMGNKKLSSGIPIEGVEGMRVWKYGRSSQYTEGTIDDITFAFRMTYDVVSIVNGSINLEEKPVVFRNQMSILGRNGYESTRPFATDGDSGAFIIDEETGRPTGLLLGGTDRVVVANHLQHVLSHLNVEVVT
jgi:hypothetical protein